MKAEVSQSDIEYLTLTATRFKALLELWQIATGDDPAKVVRQLDRLIECKDRPCAHRNGWPAEIITALKAGAALRRAERPAAVDGEPRANSGNKPGVVPDESILPKEAE